MQHCGGPEAQFGLAHSEHQVFVGRSGLEVAAHHAQQIAVCEHGRTARFAAHCPNGIRAEQSGHHRARRRIAHGVRLDTLHAVDDLHDRSPIARQMMREPQALDRDVDAEGTIVAAGVEWCIAHGPLCW